MQSRQSKSAGQNGPAGLFYPRRRLGAAAVGAELLRLVLDALRCPLWLVVRLTEFAGTLTDTLTDTLGQNLGRLLGAMNRLERRLASCCR